jgi:SAM-dependent methyltransferase
VDEPLQLSAPLARRLSIKLCGGCEWLHGFWQCLRLLELAADPGRHAQFYGGALAGAKGASRVLISGAADYSMLAHAVAAFRARDVEPHITVIDTCETPLELNRWYAEHVGCRIETHRGSVLDYAPPASFDVVCTHSFFGQFPGSDRPRLLEAWRRLLHPGGRVVTAHPLRPGGADEPNRFSPEQARAFRAAVEVRAAELAGLLQSSVDNVMRQAERYLDTRYGYPVRSVEELRALFEGAGFALEHLESVAIPGNQREIGGPGLRNAKVRYAHIIATRR